MNNFQEYLTNVSFLDADRFNIFIAFIYCFALFIAKIYTKYGFIFYTTNSFLICF